LVFAGFDSLQALTTTTCRPFDAQRDGLVLGEGAGVLAMESLESAHRRDAEILGEVIGYGTSTDVHHLTQPQPEGRAVWAAMEDACTRAGVTPVQVDYVNAHGTGTPLNDAAEAAALVNWAGAGATRLPVSSTKGSIGHLLGAAGAVEAIVCLMALREQWLPPEPMVARPDAACGFDLVREPREARVDVALSNSIGLGCGPAARRGGQRRTPAGVTVNVSLRSEAARGTQGSPTGAAAGLPPASAPAPRRPHFAVHRGGGTGSAGRSPVQSCACSAHGHRAGGAGGSDRLFGTILRRGGAESGDGQSDVVS
jgi:hypothetical protein